jgi:hypothetical protein
MYKIDKFDLPGMRDDGSIKITEKYTIAEYEPRGLRLEELAIRLCSEISTYFILYDYKGTISTDNDEVLELLKEKYRSGDCEIYSSKDDFHGDNLTIYYDEILTYKSDGSYTWTKYIPKWNTVYKKLAKFLFNLNNNPFEKENFIGNTLYKKCFNDKEFVENNEWIKKFDSVWEVGNLDPIHIFASINSSNLGNEKRLARINTLFRLFDSNFTENDKYAKINFDGCPSPMATNIISARNEENQKKIWEYFLDVFANSQNANIDFTEVKNWYGIDIGSFTIFLFWIDSKNFIPLDKNTVALLEKYKKINKLPETFEEYISLLIKKNTNLYRNIAFIAYDSSQQNLLNKHERAELEEYLIGQKSRNTYSDSISENISEITPATSNGIVDGQQLIQDAVVNVESAGHRTIEVSGAITIYSSNSGLKLISLKPLIGCSKDYLKTLKEDENYVFDKAYDTQSDDKIVVNKEIALSLYDFHDLNINIHAIVGKNGTGKSTLVELLFAIINNLACKKNINDDLEFIPSLKAELFFEHVELYKIVVDNDNISIYQYEKQEDNYINPRLMSIDEFDLNHLFYTIAVNYSQHSLNCLHLGSWLNALFHKNDAYQTPIVIEPFRKDGNVDINRQSDLVKQRLLANLLEFEVDKEEQYSFRRLTEYYKAVSLKLKFNNKKLFYTENKIRKISGTFIYKDDDIKIKYMFYRNSYKEILEKLYRRFDLQREVEVDFLSSFGRYTFEQKVDLYLLKKLISISNKYQFYKKYFNKNSYEFMDLENYLDDLYHDTSHITYKLKQAVNFLRFDSIIEKKESEQIWSIENLSDNIEKIKQDHQEEKLSTTELIPPSFFTTEIILENDIKFEQLSSGEKQKIYSINSILYHLNNLNSVDLGYVEHKYKFVNIVLDEVELYFHPELQRTYLSDLHNALSKVNYSNLIGLNICFVTHSPFILSDIPNTKILFLEKESNDLDAKTMPSKKEIKTLGANIHELLINGFFMNSSMGDFAWKQIDDIIKFHNEVTNTSENMIDSFKAKYEKIKAKFHFIQEHIGEDYISGVLKSHIEEIEAKLNDDDFKKRRIYQLEAELNILRGS